MNRLFELPKEVLVFPGHDYGVRAESTLEDEKRDNPFCQRLNNFQDFCWLKENWASYKKEHGLV